MSENTILPKTRKILSNPLTENSHKAYFIPAATKNSSLDWPPVLLIEMHSRILRGFFYARNLVSCATMVDCVGEPLVSAIGSPHFSICGKANPAQSVTFQLALEMTVSKLDRETVNV